MVRICDLSRVNTAPRQLRCGTLSGYLPCLSPAAPPEGLTMDSDHSIADAAYRGGELGILELLDAFRGAVDDELQGLELALLARRARIELERAAGGGFP